MKAFLIDQKLTGNPIPPELQIQPVSDLRVQFSYKDFGIGLRWTDPDSSVWVKTVIKWSREQPTGDLETAGRTIVETTTKNQYKETTFVEAFAATNYYIWAITYGSNGTKAISEQIFLSADSFQILDTTSIINAVDLQIHATNGWNVKYSIADVKNLSSPVVLSAEDGTTLFDSSWITSITLTSTELFNSSNLLSLTVKDGRIFTYDSEETEAIDKTLPFQVNFGHIVQWKRPNQNSIFSHSDWPESTKNKEITEPTLLTEDNLVLTSSISGSTNTLTFTNPSTGAYSWYHINLVQVKNNRTNNYITGGYYSELSSKPYTTETLTDNSYQKGDTYTVDFNYTISPRQNGITTNREMNFTYTPPAVFDWDTASWEDIYNLCVRSVSENLDLHDFISIGMTKSKEISGVSYEAIVIGVNEEPTGNPSITFKMKTCPDDTTYFGNSGTYGGEINCFSANLENYILPQYFQDIKDYMLLLKKEWSNKGVKAIDSAKHLWLVSGAEMNLSGDGISCYTSGNSTSYSYFTDNSSRISYKKSSNSPIIYWTRIQRGSGTYVNIIMNDGTLYYTSAGDYASLYGGLAFVIGYISPEPPREEDPDETTDPEEPEEPV